jgi:tetratricopeptide (TPR) repeat protein
VRTAICVAVASLVSWPATAWSQGFSDIRKQFESGKYQEVAKLIAESGDRSPQLLYLAGQAYRKLDQQDQARGAYGSLAGGSEGSAWTFIGRSAIAVMETNYDEALATAQKAASLDGGLAEAHYQLGLVHAFRQDFAAAAAALDRASELDPQFGSAHYQAGLAHYRNKRPDRMASHFEMFLKVAPQAPERPEVESILRTLSGR